MLKVSSYKRGGIYHEYAIFATDRLFSGRGTFGPVLGPLRGFCPLRSGCRQIRSRPYLQSLEDCRLRGVRPRWTLNKFLASHVWPCDRVFEFNPKNRREWEGGARGVEKAISFWEGFPLFEEGFRLKKGLQEAPGNHQRTYSLRLKG